MKAGWNLALVLAVGVGCVPDTGVEAPSNAALLAIPSEFTLAWHYDFNLSSDIGALLMMDFIVYDVNTGIPMPGIQVEVISNWSGVVLIPKTAIKVVPYPPEPDPDTCDADGDGLIDADAPDECSWYWDSSGNQYFQIAGGYADAYSPGYLVGATDSSGILRVYAFVDALPLAEDVTTGSDLAALNYAPVSVDATIGHYFEQVIISTSSN